MRGMTRKVLCCGLALLMALSYASFCFAEEGDSSREQELAPRSWVRLAGDNRYETSLLVGNEVGRSLSSTYIYEGVIIASGTGYADALSSSCLQHTGYAPAPVLLVNDDLHVMKKVAEDIRDHFARNGYDMTKEIWIMGGYGAVSSKMEDCLTEAGLERYISFRFDGADRFETNLKTLYICSDAHRPLIVCSGYSFADALSASSCRCDILLVGASLTKEQEEYIQRRIKGNNSDKTCVIAGGTGAVSENVESKLAELGMETVRLAGKDRYETSYKIAEYFFTANPYYAILVYGGDFPDGLSGGPLGGACGGPVLLVDDAHSEYAVKYSEEHSSVRIFKVLGGQSLITDEAVERIVNAGA